MLNTKVNKIVAEKVRPLISTGKCVSLRRNSPYADLCDSTRMWMPSVSAISVYNAKPRALFVAQKDNKEHAHIQEELAKDIADRLAANIGYIKGTVVDAVLDCKKFVDTQVSHLEPTPDVVIKERRIPEIIYDPNSPINLTLNVTDVAITATNIGVQYKLDSVSLNMDKHTYDTWV